MAQAGEGDRGGAAARGPLAAELLGHLAESVIDYAIVLLDLAGRIVSFNGGATRLYGYAPQEAIGREFADFYPPSARSAGQPREIWETALAEGHYDGEVLQQRQDGSTFVGLLTLTALRKAPGRTEGLALLVRDVTAQRDLRHKLWQEAEGFRTTLQSIGDAVIATNAKGRVELVNPVAEALTGWTSDQAHGRPLDEVFRIVDEHTRRPVASPVERVLAEGVVVGLANHTLLIARDGREIPIADAGAPIRNDQGQVTGVVLVFRDQTVQRRQEQREAAERELLQRIVEGEPLLQWLERLCRTYEQLYPPGLCSVLLLEGERLKHAAAPSLPPDYCRAIDGLTIGPSVGSCGTAAYTGEPVLVADIAHDSRWEGFQELARHHGLAACWSIPICSGGPHPLGTFAVYYPQPRYPVAEELASLQRWAWLAGLAIERARDQATLRESEERHRHISELISDYAYALRVEAGGVLRPQWISDSFLRMFGRTLADLAVPDAWRTLVHPDDFPIAQSHAERILAGHTDVCELRLVTPAGQIRWLRNYAVPRWDEQAQRVVRIYGAAQDVTQRREHEEALRRRHQELTSLIRSIDGIVWEADAATFRFTFVSDKAERLLGYPLRQWLEEPDFWQNHLHPDDREMAVALCRTATESGRDHDLEYRMLAADGRVVWVRDLVTVEVVQGRPQRLRGILVDITARKQLEAQLQQAQKMEAIGRLAGGLAHDFNNLLTVINGHAELLLAAHPPSTSLHDSAAAIAEAGQRAAWLTEQLLAFSRQTVTAPQVLDLNEVIRQTERLLRQLIGEAIELSLDLQEPLPAVRLDPGRVSQVLINLAINARDAMPRGGSLTIATRTVQRASPREPALSPASWVVLTVRDTGHGMPPEVKARIFEPFFTTKPAGSGTGLGLAVVYGIVQQAGGWIDVESEPGQGACFHLHFPSLEETPRPPPAPPLPAPVRRGTETILVVEDEGGVRGLVRTVLARQGYRVLVAESPAQALALLAEHGQPIDLLLTDLVMPGLSGRELAARLTAQQPGMKVLYMSGYTNDEALRRDLVHETVDFLAKPFTPQALLDKVQAILARGTGSQAMP